MENDRKSLTPCLDENNAVEQNQKSMSDLSSISDEDEKNWDVLKSEPNKNGKDSSDLFKKITKKARERNYRDKATEKVVKSGDANGDGSKRYQKRSEIQRYDVRNVIRDGREFSFSKSRSRSRSPAKRVSNHPRKVLRSPLRSRHNSDSRRYSRRHSRSPSPEHRKYNDRNSTEKSRKSRYSSRNFRSSKEKKSLYSDESRSRHRKSRKSRSPSVTETKQSSQISRQIKNISQENIKIILQNKEVPPAKRSKHSKKEKKSKKQHRDSESRDKNFKSTDNTPGDGISKEVIASGDNILISVSFNNKNNGQKEKVKDKTPEIVAKSPKRRKSLTPKSPPIVSISKRSKVKKRKERKHTKPISSSQNSNNHHPHKNIRKNDLKPIAFIDLDKSPGKEVLSSPKEIIVLTDSENEGTRKDNSSKDVMIIDDIIEDDQPPPESPPVPPQPVLKFSISKKSNILPFNLLHDHEEENAEKEEGDDNDTTEPTERHSNDVYDPFNPTNSKSNSPTHLQQILNDVSSSSDMIKNRKDSPLLEKSCLLEENIISSTNSIRIEKKTTTPPPSTLLMIPSSILNAKSAPFYDASFIDFKTFKAPSPKIIVHEKKTLNEEDEATPYSPSSEGYQYDSAPMEPESPKEHEVSNDSCFNDDLKKKNMPKNAGTLSNFKSMQDMQYGRKTATNKNEQNFFDTLHPTQKSPATKRQSSSSFLRSKIKRYRNSLMDIDSLKPPMFNEKSTGKDDPFNDDDVPNSAVDLLNKDKMLKKSLRIERVAEEVKLVLKPHYNKKHITKEEYKEILRKAVPKIYHNKTGEINIQKIHNLVEAYIKKFRYRRKSAPNVNL